MKRILIPTDFSAPAVPAYQFAVQLAEKIKAEVLVAHVVELPLLQETTFGIQPLTADPQFMKLMEDKALAAFSKLSERYPSSASVRFYPLSGNVVSSLVLFAEEQHVDLIVMGPRGEGALDEFFTGSVAARVLRRSTVPTLFIPKAFPVASVHSIVFPNTLTLDQASLVNQLKTLQQWFDAVVHVLLVCTPINFCSEQEAKSKLQQFVEFYGLKNVTLNHRNHRYESAGILAFLDEINGDMLAMSTHGRTGLVRLLRGSIAESLVYNMDKPVWGWKPK